MPRGLFFLNLDQVLCFRFLLSFFLSSPSVLRSWRSLVTRDPSLSVCSKRRKKAHLTPYSVPIQNQPPPKKNHSAAVVAPRAQAAGSREIASGPTATPFDDFKFAPIREATVSRAMTSRYFKVREKI